MSVANSANTLMSNIVAYRTYAKYIPGLHRRETLSEAIDRNMQMHMDRFPSLIDNIYSTYRHVKLGNILPSMRGLQFGGPGVEYNPIRQYNCAYHAINTITAFAETLFLLLSGTGVGYSVQKHHTDQLPTVKKPTEKMYYTIHDSIEGWAMALDTLIQSFFLRKPEPQFDYFMIRPEGSLLKTTGGLAPGPVKLEKMLELVRSRLVSAIGRKLRPIEIHHIQCIISDCVRSGGIREAALIALFDRFDGEMLKCKSGKWWEESPWLGRANNSAIMPRNEVSFEEFSSIYDVLHNNQTGEPGFYWTNNSGSYGTNPCQPGWATLCTPDGIRTFNDVDIGSTIWSGKQWTKITNKACTGVKPVYAYHTTAGIFYGTENHRIVQNGTKIEVKDAESIDISTCGDYQYLEPLNPQDIIDGLMVGDGTYHKLLDKRFLIIGQDDQDYFNSEIKDLVLGPVGWKDNNTHYHVKTTIYPNELCKMWDRSVPDRFKYASPTKMRGFLRGIFTANSSVPGARTTLKSTSINIIRDVQQMLSALGIRSYYTTNKPSTIEWANGTYESKESYDLNISPDRNKFAKLIGFIQGYKTAKLDSLCMSIGQPTHVKTTYNIIKTELIGEEPVYDITVEADEHTYWTGGLLVSNCCEIALRHRQFCNLTTVNQSNIQSPADLYDRVRAAAFLGTLQASYTNFPFLDDQWRRTTEEEALIGVSFTGIADAGAKATPYMLRQAARIVVDENLYTANILGINRAARCTTGKPEGSSSAILGTSSGIHARHAQNWYLRRLRLKDGTPLAKFLLLNVPELMEQSQRDDNIIITIPQKSPNGAISRDCETAIDLFHRTMEYNLNWISPGHVSGDNFNNMSCTINVQEHEWEPLKNLMWENKHQYNGLSILPYDGGTYVQAPFETCDEQTYNKYLSYIKPLDFTTIEEFTDTTDRSSTLACSGALGCEIT